MKVLQILPELNSGGVERGTVQVADFLVREGHEALVVSNGGRLVPVLKECGVRHVAMAVHKKSPLSFLKIAPLRRLLRQERPDILHARSRVPAWIAWLAWKGLPPGNRPHFVTTVHGFYSINFYSGIMTRGERVIAVSESIRQYILENYRRTPPGVIRVIHRGVTAEDFPRGYRPSPEWLAQWTREQPRLSNRRVLLLPARLTRWKGQEDFLRLIASLKAEGEPVHGLLAGEVRQNKQSFLDELRALATRLGIADDVTFLGHRNDLREVMAVSDIVLSLSRDPEAFGRVTLEAAALGRPVVGYSHGGVREQLEIIYPAGLVTLGDHTGLVDVVRRQLRSPEMPTEIKPPFTRESMCRATLDTYAELLGNG